MANHFYTSDGVRLTQATIERKRGEAYREAYGHLGYVVCEGCGQKAEGSSHILSQKACKYSHRSELIWDRRNFFPACHSCNRRWENNDRELMNYQRCMEILKELDFEDYTKRQLLR